MQGINRHMNKYERGDETGSHCIIVPDTLSLCRMSRTGRVHTSEDVGERMKSPLIKKEEDDSRDGESKGRANGGMGVG